MGTFQEKRLLLNGLEHVVLEWPSEGPEHGVCVLIHGYMDAAGTWDLVAPSLSTAGFRVLAPHLRGFGAGPRIKEGSYYHFPDYVFDIVSFLQTLATPVVLIGHSLGGTIAGSVAGSYPSLVSRLVLLEGLGPPSSTFDDVPDRLHRFVFDMQKWGERREHKPMASPASALERLKLSHPGIDPDILRTRIPHLVEEVGGGAVVWRFDPLHRVHSAFPFFASSFKALLRRVSCETLLVGGGPEGFHPEDEAERAGALAVSTYVEVPGAGHMMHWTKPGEVSRAIVEFLSRTGRS